METLILLFCLAAGPAPAAQPAAASSRLELHDGDRVAFIGNTFFEREQVDCFIETALTSRYPDRNITFRNLGYSGDTVTGEARGLCMGWAIFETSDKAFERLKKLVAEYKPTVLMINYGMTESFFGPEKLPEFTANYEKMLDALSEAAGTSPHLVLMAPNYHEDMGRPLPDPTEHNKNLKLYSNAIKEIAAKRNAVFIDLFEALKNFNLLLKGKYSTNGIHLNASGYWYIAQDIDLWLEGSFTGPRSWHLELDSTGGVVKEEHAKISEAHKKDNGLTFVVTPQSLPLPPIILGQPLRMSSSHLWRRITVTGLAPGKYQLKAGDQIVASDTEAGWARGVDLHPMFSPEIGPDVEQAEALRKLIVAKNFDYFNYQRPDNDSYILAFRKREQGRNAVEIPQFLSLVEEKEKQIATLRVPKPVTYSLEKVQ